jgi:hypothetical protein
LSLNKILREYGGDFSLLAPAVEEGLDFILGHFDLADYIWPRTISTKTSQGRQIPVYNKEEALARFKQSNFQDCRINAFPSTKYTRHLTPPHPVRSGCLPLIQSITTKVHRLSKYQRKLLKNSGCQLALKLLFLHGEPLISSKTGLVKVV